MKGMEAQTGGLSGIYMSLNADEFRMYMYMYMYIHTSRFFVMATPSKKIIIIYFLPIKGPAAYWYPFPGLLTPLSLIEESLVNKENEWIERFKKKKN